MTHAVRSLPSGAVVHSWTAASPRAVVVLQHGFGEYAERYLDQFAGLVPRLLAAGYDVWALDLWGHGRSPGRRGVTSIGRAVRDHIEVRRLAARPQLPMALVGHSLGGLVTACSAQSSTADLAGVVLMSPALSRPEPDPVRRMLGAVAAVVPWVPIPRRRRPVGELSRLPVVGERAASDPLMFGGQVPVLTAATALDQAELLWAGLGEWHVPTLVLHGTADTYTDPAGSSDFVVGIASEDKTLHLVDGAFHELLNDACAAELAGLVKGWLGRLRPDR